MSTREAYKRRDRIWKDTNIVVAVALLGTACLLVGVVTLFMRAQMPETGAAAEKHFRRIVGVNSAHYSEIEFRSSTGIDYHYGFKFRFENEADIARIIAAHDLEQTDTNKFSQQVGDIVHSLSVTRSGIAYFDEFSL